MADLIAPLPLIVLESGALVQFEAIDPATGAAVAGVRIASASIYAAKVDADLGDEALQRLFLMHGGD